MRPDRFLQTTVATTHLALGSTSSEQDQFKHVTWDDDNSVISTHALDQGHYQSRLTLANGYFGINVASAGPFFEVDEPVDGDAFSTIAGFWNSQPRTVGSNYPWLYHFIAVEANGEFLNASVNPDHISDFVSSLDVKAGIANWRYNWKPGGRGDGTIDLFVHKLYINKAAVKLRLTSTRDDNVTVYDILDGDAAVRSDFKFEKDTPTIWSAVSPGNITNVTAYVYSTLGASDWVDLSAHGVFGSGNKSTIAQSVPVELTAFRPTEVTKFIGVASTDAFPDPQTVAREASISGAKEGYYKLLQSHIREWESILTPDAVDDYHLPNGSLPDDPDVQQLHILARTNPFYLLSNMVGPNAVAAAGNNTKLDIYSIPVCGFGSDCYGGMIFWDATVWMAPGIQVSHPQHAQNVIKYHVEHFEQAQRNVQTAFTSSKNQTSRFTPGGAVYPWTSARFGNCTGTGACFDYEYHLNGDMSLAFNNHLIITGDGEYFNDTLLPISNSIAHFFGQVLDFNETSGNWELWNATDPDEYANQVNNVGFTTALIQKHFLETNEFNSWFARSQNASWNEKAAKMRLPVNDNTGIIVEYTGMNGSVAVKQADVVLIDDLLHYPNPYSLTNLDFYAAKQSLDGPAMTYSSFAVVANEVSPSGCSSFTYHVYSSSPYLRAPWYQYSEQLIDNVEENGGTHPAFPFLTGMGGTNRVAIFGYLGLGLYYDRLDIDPSLPPQIPYLNYRTFYWMGHGINATSNSTHTTLARLPRDKYSLPSVNATYFDKPIPVTVGTRSGRNVTWHELGQEPLVVRNRPMGEVLTVSGNILQCKSLLRPPQRNKPGQFPIAAIDGAASTKWQPEYANITSYLTVDLGDSAFYPISEIVMDWANQPPAYFEIYFSNSSLPPFSAQLTEDVRRVIAGSVDISAPWDPVTAYEIRPYVGNQTNITLTESVWSGRYAHLGVRGNQFKEDATDGPTVAEWSLVREKF
ncbi:LOW QUALITY PROTEIN: acid trehalase [Bipolaris maydis]|nr:LOW QUALITY PROTEIN: acid trehalase [Bipolaris maydis]